jgi:hypothetical protein
LSDKAVLGLGKTAILSFFGLGQQEDILDSQARMCKVLSRSKASSAGPRSHCAKASFTSSWKKAAISRTSSILLTASYKKLSIGQTSIWGERYLDKIRIHENGSEKKKYELEASLEKIDPRVACKDPGLL